MSLCRRQIIDVVTPPISEMTMIGVDSNLFMASNIINIRANPYLPSFNRIAARIIDPATGASTWAFGNHR